MDRIKSFTVDHTRVQPGIYISQTNSDIVTYDLRMKTPNESDLLDNTTMHSFEHMFATYIRNSDISEDVIYFGPMGCQTGFYLLIRNHTKEEVLEVVMKVLNLILTHNGNVFGASAAECGNYRNLNLESAQQLSRAYLGILNSNKNSFHYDE